jgi:TP901 family phage tail tape measure protein
VAFEDLIFRLKSETEDLKKQIVTALREAARSAKIKIPVQLDAKAAAESLQAGLAKRTFKVKLQFTETQREARKAATQAAKAAAQAPKFQPSGPQLGLGALRTEQIKQAEAAAKNTAEAAKKSASDAQKAAAAEIKELEKIAAARQKIIDKNVNAQRKAFNEQARQSKQQAQIDKVLFKERVAEIVRQPRALGALIPRQEPRGLISQRLAPEIQQLEIARKGLERAFARRLPEQRRLVAEERAFPTEAPARRFAALETPRIDPRLIRAQQDKIEAEFKNGLRRFTAASEIQAGGIFKRSFDELKKTNIFQILSARAATFGEQIKGLGLGIQASFFNRFGRAGVTAFNAITTPASLFSSLLGGIAGKAAQAGASMLRNFTNVRGLIGSLSGVVGKLGFSLTRIVGILSGGFLLGGAIAVPIAAFKFLSSTLEKTAEFGDQVAQSMTLLVDQFQNLQGQARLDVINRNMADLSASIKDVAVSAGLSFKEVGQGLRDIISAGVGLDDLKERQEALRVSADVAVGGVVELQDAFRGLLGLVRPFKVSFQEAGDVLFAIEKLGIAPVRELAGQIGRITPIAASGGVSLHEFAAAISTATSQSVPLESTLIGLRQIFAEFSKGGTDEANKAIKELQKSFPAFNLELSATFLRQKGLVGVLKELGKVSQDRIGSIFREVRALAPLLAILRNMTKFESDLAKIKDSSGQASLAASIRNESLRKSLDRLSSAIDVAQIAIGDQLARLINLKGIIDGVQAGIKRFADSLSAIPADTFRKFIDQFNSLKGLNVIFEFLARSYVKFITVFVAGSLKLAPVIAQALTPLFTLIVVGFKSMVNVVGGILAQFTDLVAEVFIGKLGDIVKDGLLSTIKIIAAGGGPAAATLADVLIKAFSSSEEDIKKERQALIQRIKSTTEKFELFSAEDLDPAKISKNLQGFPQVVADVASKASKALTEFFKDSPDLVTQLFGLQRGERLEDIFTRLISGGAATNVADRLKLVGEAMQDLGGNAKFVQDAVKRVSLINEFAFRQDPAKEFNLELAKVENNANKIRSRLQSIGAGGFRAAFTIEGLKQRKQEIKDLEASLRSLNARLAELQSVRAAFKKREFDPSKTLEVATNEGVDSFIESANRINDALSFIGQVKLREPKELTEAIEKSIKRVKVGAAIRDVIATTAGQTGAGIGAIALRQILEVTPIGGAEALGVKDILKKFEPLSKKTFILEDENNKAIDSILDSFVALANRGPDAFKAEIARLGIEIQRYEDAAVTGNKVVDDSFRRTAGQLSNIRDVLKQIERQFFDIGKASDDAFKVDPDADTFFFVVADRAKALQATLEAIGARSADVQKAIQAAGGFTATAGGRQGAQGIIGNVAERASEVQRIASNVFSLAVERFASIIEKFLGIGIRPGVNPIIGNVLAPGSKGGASAGAGVNPIIGNVLAPGSKGGASAGVKTANPFGAPGTPISPFDVFFSPSVAVANRLKQLPLAQTQTGTSELQEGIQQLISSVADGGQISQLPTDAFRSVIDAATKLGDPGVAQTLNIASQLFKNLGLNLGLAGPVGQTAVLQDIQNRLSTITSPAAAAAALAPPVATPTGFAFANTIDLLTSTFGIQEDLFAKVQSIRDSLVAGGAAPAELTGKLSVIEQMITNLERNQGQTTQEQEDTVLRTIVSRLEALFEKFGTSADFRSNFDNRIVNNYFNDSNFSVFETRAALGVDEPRGSR